MQTAAADELDRADIKPARLAPDGRVGGKDQGSRCAAKYKLLFALVEPDQGIGAGYLARDETGDRPLILGHRRPRLGGVRGAGTDPQSAVERHHDEAGECKCEQELDERESAARAMLSYHWRGRGRSLRLIRLTARLFAASCQSTLTVTR